MKTLRLFETQTRVPFRLIVNDEPQQEPRSDTRITYPGVGPKPDLADIYQSVSDEHQIDRPLLSQEELHLAKTEWTLPQFYEHSLKQYRQRQLSKGEVKPGTLQKERQALNQFSEWDKLQQPASWPAGNIWRGLPTGYLAGGYLERFVTHCLDTGYAVETMRGRWCHLRVIVNAACKLNVLDSPPLPKLGPIFGRYRDKLIEEMGCDDITPTSYHDDHLNAVYHGLAKDLDHQTAWVLGANSGPRTNDLFSLRWQVNIRLDHNPPDLFYIAEKTGKRHWVPLAPCVVEHLKRLAWAQRHLDSSDPHGLVFPRLTSGKSKDPEGSRVARQRTERLKAILKECCGLDGYDKASDYYKPYQVLRSTCNSRLNNHRPGRGLLVTHGKDADVSSHHYWNEHPAITEAVMTLPQPAAFLSIL